MSPLEPRKYSERLGVIDPGQLFEVAERFGLGEVTDAEPATSGLFGQNIILTTATGRFVLRGHPHGSVQLAKERRVARFIHERSSLPAPWPYEICEDTETFGWPYALMPMLDGSTGAALRQEASPDERIELAEAAGDALAMLHEAEAEFFGPYDGQLDDFIGMDDFGDWFLHRLHHWRNACRAVSALSTDAERYIDDLIESCAGALAEPFIPVLVHHDFTLDNLSFDPETFDPTGVFDLFEAYLGDAEEDLVRMLWTVEAHEREAFVGSYVGEDPLRPGAGERLALYALCDWLVVWEYRTRVGSLVEDASFLAQARPIVDNARALGAAHT